MGDKVLDEKEYLELSSFWYCYGKETLQEGMFPLASGKFNNKINSEIIAELDLSKHELVFMKNKYREENPKQPAYRLYIRFKKPYNKSGDFGSTGNEEDAPF